MADSDPTRVVDEEALSAGWSLMDDEGEIESISSEESSTADFLLDSASVAKSNLFSEGVRTVPIADYHDLVMVEISNADVSSTTKVDDTESDVDVANIDDATDDNLEDWVTTELENRLQRRKSSGTVSEMRDLQVRQARDDDESSEFSAGSSEDSDSCTAEPVQGEGLNVSEDLSPLEELPLDYPMGYRSHVRTYAHQRNTEANKSLTIALFVTLTLVAAVAFGHFRGTSVVLRHTFPGTENAAPTSVNVFSDIQKDQVEILKQLQRMLYTQGELKGRIGTLEDENKDLRLRLLESRKKCTRILHKSPLASELPVMPTNSSGGEYVSNVADSSTFKDVPIFDFHSQPVKREAIALPLSLSAVVRAKAATKVIRTNFVPVDLPTLVKKTELPSANHQPDTANLRKPEFSTVLDRFLRIPKEQVDFVMVEDVVLPLKRLLGSRQQTFRPLASRPAADFSNRAIPPLQSPMTSARQESQNQDVNGRKWAYSERPKTVPTVQPSTDESLPRIKAAASYLRSLMRTVDSDLIYSEQMNQETAPKPDLDRSASRSQGAPRKLGQEDCKRDIDYEWSTRTLIGHAKDHAPASNPDVRKVQRANTSHASKARIDRAREDIVWKKNRISEEIKLKIANVKAEIRREKDRIKSSRRKLNETSPWKNSSDRTETRSQQVEKEHKYSTGRSCKSDKTRDGYCFTKPNKYRNQQKESCGSSFWNSLPNFVKKHFGRTDKLEKVFRGLGMDIVHSKVFKKVMEEVPKKLKMSSEWLDCQWKWWQSFAGRESRSTHGGCSNYLNSWQHKHGAQQDHEMARKSRSNPDLKRSKQEQNGDSQEAARAVKEMLVSNESNWFFLRASDRADFRNKMVMAGRQVGNLTSWFFQRARDRDLQRSRTVREVEHDETFPPTAGSRHRKSGIPTDPIYEFLKHRAAWRKSAAHDF